MDDDGEFDVELDKPGYDVWLRALAERPAPSSSSSLGLWETRSPWPDGVVGAPRTGIVRLVRSRGKQCAPCGFTSMGVQCLYPEEALFLVDIGQLVFLAPSASEDDGHRELARLRLAMVEAGVWKEKAKYAQRAVGGAGEVDGAARAASVASTPSTAALATTVRTQALVDVERALQDAQEASAWLAHESVAVLTTRKAHALLLAHVATEEYVVYADLRARGFIPRRANASAGAGYFEARTGLVSIPLPRAQPLTVIFDVYVKVDGSFSRTRPGPPTFRVVILKYVICTRVQSREECGQVSVTKFTVCAERERHHQRRRR